MKMFQISQVCLWASCLCCAVKIRSSIFLISSTLRSHNAMDGGGLCFQRRGMHPFAVFSKWRTRDFLYALMGIVERCKRKKCGIVRDGIICELLGNAPDLLPKVPQLRTWPKDMDQGSLVPWTAPAPSRGGWETFLQSGGSQVPACE